MTMRQLMLAMCLGAATARPCPAQSDSLVVARNDSVSARLVNADLRLAIQAFAPYLDRPVLFGSIGEVRVTLETPRPIARAALPQLLRGMLGTYGLALNEEPGYYTVGPVAPVAPPPPSTAQSGPPQLFVIHIRHARAADVASTVNALYGRASALGEIGSPPSTLSEGLRQNLAPPVGAPTPTQVQPVMPQVAELQGDVTIIPDPRTNSLLVRASREDFDLIQAAVHELDVRPLQVLIEVVILEARKNYLLSWGVALSLPPTNVGSGNTTIEGTQGGGGLGDLVLRVLNMGSVELNAELNAGASRGDVHILSRPVLVAANNHEARILVGSQQPFVQISRTLPTDNGARDQVVQYKDVGTRLAVRPTISADGSYVTLDVQQEVSNATNETQFDAPVISTREAVTQVTVRDSQTIVLGGLVDRQRDALNGGVPFLSDLPLVGGLFGRRTRRSSETELFLFITPRVLRTDQEIERATDGYRQP